MRFRAILRWQPFSLAQSRMLISWPYRERSFYNFPARLLTIFVIWPKYSTLAISCDCETTTFFACAIAHVNIPAPTGALFL